MDKKEIWITNKQYRSLLWVLRKRKSNLNKDVYCVLSKEQYQKLLILKLDLELKFNNYVFIYLLSSFKLDKFNDKLLEFRTLKKRNIVRTFKINQLEYEKVLLIKDMYKLKSISDVFAFLIDIQNIKNNNG